MNDTFTIRPLEWEQEFPSLWHGTSYSGAKYAVAQLWEKWRWQRGNGDIHWAPSKESAMAACEQHWRKEIEPALVRVEDGRDALLGRALVALRITLPTIEGITEEAKDWARVDEDYLETAANLRREGDTVREVIAEIEKALPAAKLEPQST